MIRLRKTAVIASLALVAVIVSTTLVLRPPRDQSGGRVGIDGIRLCIEPIAHEGIGPYGVRFRMLVDDGLKDESWLEGEYRVEFVGEVVGDGETTLGMVRSGLGTGLPITKANSELISGWRDLSSERPLPKGRGIYTQTFEHKVTRERLSMSTGWIEVR